MTILLVCDVYGAENNGTVIAEKNLLRAMRERGHTVRVLCCDPASKGEQDTYVCPNRKFGPLLNAYILKNGVRLARPDKRIIAKAMEGVDIVHVFLPLPFGLGTAATKMATKMGICVTGGFHTQAENVSNHLGMMNCHWFNNRLYRFFWKAVYSHCYAIHYPTQFIEDLFEKEIGQKTPGFVISNGVRPFPVRTTPLKRPAELKGKYVITFSGRFSKEKNQTMLVKAVKLSKHKDEIQLVLAGLGPEESKLAREGASLPNKPLLRFFRHDELMDVLRMSDLYVHPALIDLESISCIEAISIGVLPLLTDSPRAAVKNYARDPHCIFHYDDPRDLADKIDWFIDHPEQAQKIKDFYRGFGDRYDFDTCMDKMEKMFKRTLAQFKSQKELKK